MTDRPEDIIYRAGRIAEAWVTINNAVNGPAMATWQPETNRVEFYLYGNDGARNGNLRFEYAGDAFIIRDMYMESGGKTLYRTDHAERALEMWAHHIHEYVL